MGIGLFEATKVAASFEQAMADVRAVMTPAEAQQFGAALDALAIRLGKDTVFSAREAAAAEAELARAGLPIEAILNGAAAAALNLAAATGISTANAAVVTAQAMNAFGLSADQVTTVVNILAGTANATAATMTDLQQGLQVVAATAHGMGLSLLDTATAIGVMVQAGTTGATAGTGLRQMLLELTPTTKPAIEEMKKLGLVTAEGKNIFFDATGKLKGMAEISQILQNATKGMSNEQRLAAFNILFTRDAINSALILSDQGSAGFNKYKDSIQQISAADQAATRLNTLQGAMNNLKSSVETVQIIIGNLFLPQLRELANNVRGIVDRFSTLDPQLQRGVVLFGSAAAAVAGLLGAMVLLGPFLSQLPAAFGALLAVLPRVLAIFGPIGLAVGILATDLGGIRTALARNFEGAGTILGNFGLAFQKALTGDVRGAVDTFQAIIGALAPGLGVVLVNVRAALAAFADAFGPILGNFGVVFQKALTGDLAGAMDTLRAILGALSPELGAFVTTALGTLTTGAEQVRLFWDTQLSPSLRALGTLLETEVAPKIQAFVDAAMPLLNTAAQTVVTFWNEQLLPALQHPGETMDALGTSVESLTTRLATLAKSGEAGPAVAGLVNFFAQFDVIKTQAESLAPLFASLGNFFQAFQNFEDALSRLEARALAPIFDQVGAGIRAFAQAIEPAQPAINAMGVGLGTIGSALTGVTDFFTNAAKAINDFADAIDKVKLPAWWPGAGNVSPTPGAGGAQVVPTAFNLAGAGPGGPGGAGGINLNFLGPFSIGSEVDAEKFLVDMAAAVRAAAGRVNTPPDNSGHPALVSGVV